MTETQLINTLHNLGIKDYHFIGTYEGENVYDVEYGYHRGIAGYPHVIFEKNGDYEIKVGFEPFYIYVKLKENNDKNPT